MSLRPPAVIPELLARLRADAAFDGALVRWGLLAQLPDQRERVYLLGVTDYELVPTTSGHRVRTEGYEVRGLVEVHDLDTGGPEEASTRAWALVEAMDRVLHADPDLSAGGRYTDALRVQADEVVPMTDGWLARIVLRLGVEGHQ